MLLLRMLEIIRNPKFILILIKTHGHLQCRELVQYVIDKKTCIGCGACIKACPSSAVSGEKKKAHTINKKKCIKCGACSEICPVGAVLT